MKDSYHEAGITSLKRMFYSSNNQSGGDSMQKITPFLWFDNQAEEAAKFYVSIFSTAGGSASGGKNSKMGNISRYGKEGYEIHRRPAGTAMTVQFQLEGQDFVALNGGPVFKFNEAISFQVLCKTQEEVDYYWEKLSEGGDKKAQQCGWLKDKYGLSWQIVPTGLSEMLRHKDAKKSDRVMKALFQMKKIDTKLLEQAYEKE